MVLAICVNKPTSAGISTLRLCGIRIFAPNQAAERMTGGGTVGNERLTAATGILLVVLLAVIGVTLLRLRPLISVHLFVGLVLIPVVCLKLASTGYRFVRYYTSDPAYRKRGAPPILLRVSAPIVVATSLAVLATGVALLFLGPESSGTLRAAAQGEFHRVGRHSLPCTFSGTCPTYKRFFSPIAAVASSTTDMPPARAGESSRSSARCVAGVVLAIVLIPHFGAWTHFEIFRHHH